MHLAVIDPRLLVEAHKHPNGRAAKLWALFVYGHVSSDAYGPQQLHEEAGQLVTEYEGIVDSAELAAVQAFADRQRRIARDRRSRIEDVLEQLVPGDLLLVTSNPLREELHELAHAAQSQGARHVAPHLVLRQTARWTAKHLSELAPAPFYLGEARVSEREYLIHTAITGEADSLITDDQDLALPGNASHSDPRTRARVRPYSLEEFIADQLPHNLDLDAIDAAEVSRAAAR